MTKRIRKAVFPSPASARAFSRPPRRSRRKCSRSSIVPSCSMAWTKRARPESNISFSSRAATRRSLRTISTSPMSSRTRSRRQQDQGIRSSAGGLPEGGRESFTRQQAPLGLGHAVWCAREIIGDEPFAVLLPDMITCPAAERPLSRPMHRGLREARRQYDRRRGSAAGGDPPIWRRRHGKDFGPTFEITGMVEKPPQGTAPDISSFRAAISWTRKFSLFPKCRQRRGGEIQLTDGMRACVRSKHFMAFASMARLTTRLEGRLPGSKCRLRHGASRHRRQPAGGNREAFGVSGNLGP